MWNTSYAVRVVHCECDAFCGPPVAGDANMLGVVRANFWMYLGPHQTIVAGGRLGMQLPGKPSRGVRKEVGG